MPAQKSLFHFTNKNPYQQIRNYLAGQLLGATRDEVLLEEVIKSLFCKIYLEENQVVIDPNNLTNTAEKYRCAFSKLRLELPSVLGKYNEFLLDPASIAFVHRSLSVSRTPLHPPRFSTRS